MRLLKFVNWVISAIYVCAIVVAELSFLCLLLLSVILLLLLLLLLFSNSFYFMFVA